MKIFFLLFLIMRVFSASAAVSLAKPGCPDSCGEVAIPYPFGIGKGCYMNEWFSIICNKTHSNHWRPFLSVYKVRVFEISLEGGTISINNNAISEFAGGFGRFTTTGMNLGESPYFYISATHNVLAAFGCGVVATIRQYNQIVAGCIAICSEPISATWGSQGFCQTMIPYGLNNYTLNINKTDEADTFNFGFASLIHKRWYERHSSSIGFYNGTYYLVPMVLGWWILPNETCQLPNKCNNIQCSLQRSGTVARCSCAEGFHGNPYLPHGCEDVDECLTENNCTNTCYGTSDEKCNTCYNIPGSYNCSCPPGYIGDARIGGKGCFMIIKNEPNFKRIFLIGAGIGISLLFVLVGTWWLYQLIKRRRKIKMKEFYFKRNGGLLLQQQYTMLGSLEKCKLFSLEELNTASDNFNENRILGSGGQSMVYKGMLSDGRIIAIKKFKLANEGQVKQFINEVVILSQINHRNVVKLLGCCLENEVPLLVYEFVPNGTLSDLIHGRNVQDFMVSWSMRIRIAMEIARAIFYLHSTASFPIYHGDIKSANILLDDKYRAKVSDFGISRLIPSEKTHVTTQVKGTFGYLDPEFFRSGRLTEKSDVYSFGVVLVELLTGKKLIYTTALEEKRSLVDFFLSSMKENQLLDILDPQVVKEGKKEEIMVMANLAQRCLYMIGKDRPSIQEVAMELEGITLLKQALTTQENSKHGQECECDLGLSSASACASETVASSLSCAQLDQAMKFYTM